MGRRLIACLLLFRKPISFIRVSNGVNFLRDFLNLFGVDVKLVSYPTGVTDRG